MDLSLKWSVETARQFAIHDRLEEWIHAYLSTGSWVNSGLSEGLKKAPRWWIGPILVPIEDMIRTCGPESEMPYKVSLSQWEKKTREMTLNFDDPVKLPPVILQNVTGHLYTRDGNHRLESARQKGWQALWAIIWFDSEKEWKTSKFQEKKM